MTAALSKAQLHLLKTIMTHEDKGDGGLPILLAEGWRTTTIRSLFGARLIEGDNEWLPSCRFLFITSAGRAALSNLSGE